ncbi:MAG: GTPase domain-containing protein [Deltaproteobacteria bacterium]|nr:GTPase domain-containing protein [Deltaproteobacteria bacterium]
MYYSPELKQYCYRLLLSGIASAGKLTSLQALAEQINKNYRTEIVDFGTGENYQSTHSLVISLPQANGGNCQFSIFCCQQLSTQRGQNLLKNTDGIVFVVDSQANCLEANIRYLIQLISELRKLQIAPENFPIFYQFNKRDHGEALTVEELNEKLNPLNAPFFSTSQEDKASTLQMYEQIFRTLLQKSAVPV